MPVKPASTFTALSVPIADPRSGLPSWTWTKKFQEWEQKLFSTINLVGQYIGTIGQTAQIDGRSEAIGITVQHLDSQGVVLPQGIDFARGYQNQTTDYIADGKGSPLAGGATAYQALVGSKPENGTALIFNGQEWTSAQVAYDQVAGTPIQAQSAEAPPNQWLDSYDAATGKFTASQPQFSAIAGQVSAQQLPANVPNVSYGSGVPSGASTESYFYFDTSVSPYQGYVYHLGAWQKWA